jgi:hypothetical protein
VALVAAGGHEPGNAQAGAGADQRNRGAGQRFAAAHLAQLIACERGQGEREGGEIVEHQEPPETELGLKRRDRESPVVVGHRHLIADHRVGDRDRAFGRRGAADDLEVARQCR